MKLQGKIAIVTGADSGIGQATAEALAREGADVCITWHTDQDGAAETRRRVEAAGRRAHVAQVDVGDPAGVRELFRASAAALGTPDLLVANAGKAMSGMPVAEMEDAKLEQILRIDLMAPLFCAREFVRARREAGGADEGGAARLLVLRVNSQGLAARRSAIRAGASGRVASGARRRLARSRRRMPSARACSEMASTRSAPRTSSARASRKRRVAADSW